MLPNPVTPQKRRKKIPKMSPDETVRFRAVQATVTEEAETQPIQPAQMASETLTLVTESESSSQQKQHQSSNANITWQTLTGNKTFPQHAVVEHHNFPITCSKCIDKSKKIKNAKRQAYRLKKRCAMLKAKVQQLQKVHTRLLTCLSRL